MQGVLIYNKEEVEINRAFIDMLCYAGEKHGLKLRLTTKENPLEMKADFVINRTRDYTLAKRYEDKGIRVFNNSYVCRIGNDKLYAYRTIDKLEIGYMPIVESEIKFPYFLKSRSGHGGHQVFMVNNTNDLAGALRMIKGESYICQKVASDQGKDLRVYMLGNRIVKAILRKSYDDFRSNYGLGGTADIYSLNENEKSLVYQISEYIKADYVGIDFVFHNGKLMFNEIEDVVGARMLYKATDINIAELFIAYIERQILREP